MRFNKYCFVPDAELDVLIGDEISFERRGMTIYGVVELIRELSVIIEVNESTQKFLQLENHLTVVNHKNYKVVKRNVACTN